MPRKQAVCALCGKHCRGKRCRTCALAFGVRNYSRENADDQRMTVKPDRGSPAQRGSWWLGTAPEDFTAVASVMVVPVGWVKTYYNWQTDY